MTRTLRSKERLTKSANENSFDQGISGVLCSSQRRRFSSQSLHRVSSLLSSSSSELADDSSPTVFVLSLLNPPSSVQQLLRFFLPTSTSTPPLDFNFLSRSVVRSFTLSLLFHRLCSRSKRQNKIFSLESTTITSKGSLRNAWSEWESIG